MKTLSDEWFILQFLKRWTPEHIRRAVEEDVDLAELAMKHRVVSTPLLKLASKYNHTSVSVGDVLYWLSLRRPDLYSALVADEKGVEWLTRNIESIKNLMGRE